LFALFDVFKRVSCPIGHQHNPRGRATSVDTDPHNGPDFAFVLSRLLLFLSLVLSSSLPLFPLPAPAPAHERANSTKPETSLRSMSSRHCLQPHVGCRFQKHVTALQPQLDGISSHHHIPTRYILILSSHIRLFLPTGIFPSGFITKTLHPFHFSPPPACCYLLHALPILSSLANKTSSGNKEPHSKRRVSLGSSVNSG
jgi:hypothetical protein